MSETRVCQLHNFKRGGRDVLKFFNPATTVTDKHERFKGPLNFLSFCLYFYDSSVLSRLDTPVPHPETFEFLQEEMSFLWQRDNDIKWRH